MVEVQQPPFKLWQKARDCPKADEYFDALMVAHGHEPLTGECIVGGMNWPVCAVGVALHDECREDRVAKVQAVLDRWGEQRD